MKTLILAVTAALGTLRAGAAQSDRTGIPSPGDLMRQSARSLRSLLSPAPRPIPVPVRAARRGDDLPAKRNKGYKI